MNEKDRPYHPIANLFPLMQGDGYDQLKADIEKNGLLEAIWLHPDESIIDGRNRHRACIETNVPPRFRTWSGQGSLVAFVVSLNLHRRHLTSGQRAVVALDVLPMLEAEAKDRQGARTDLTSVNSLTEVEPQRATSDAAELFQTNRQYVSDAKRIQQDAPDLLEQVRSGELSLPKAKDRLDQRNGRPHVSHSSGNNEWYTPPEFIDAALAVMGQIDLDPASSDRANEIVKADTHYTAQDDGLEREWLGHVWMNPPYSISLIGKFCAKLAHHVRLGDIPEACVLVNNATETGWFNMLLDVSSSICFIRGRIKFIDAEGNPSGSPLQGQVILYIGPRDERFAEEFGQFGSIFHAR